MRKKKNLYYFNAVVREDVVLLTRETSTCVQSWGAKQDGKSTEIRFTSLQEGIGIEWRKEKWILVENLKCVIDNDPKRLFTIRRNS